MLAFRCEGSEREPCTALPLPPELLARPAEPHWHAGPAPADNAVDSTGSASSDGGMGSQAALLSLWPHLHAARVGLAQQLRIRPWDVMPDAPLQRLCTHPRMALQELARVDGVGACIGAQRACTCVHA